MMQSDQGQTYVAVAPDKPIQQQHSNNIGDKNDNKGISKQNIATISSSLSRDLQTPSRFSTQKTENELQGTSHMLLPTGIQTQEGSQNSKVFQPQNQNDITSHSSSINDRFSTSKTVGQTMMQTPQKQKPQTSQPELYWEDDEDESSEDEQDIAQLNRVRVVVRVRPLIQGESTMIQRNVTNTSGQMQVDSTRNTIRLQFDARNKEPKAFQFDSICDGSVDQRTFFTNVGVKGMIRQVVNGFHATIFAYGQTGAGKTYTMEGYKYSVNQKGQFEPQIHQAMGANQVGLVQRCSKQLMKYLSKKTGDRRITINVSFLQLYNEKIFDLLNRDMFKPGKQGKLLFNVNRGEEGLKLKWNQYDIYTVENLMNVECEDVNEILHLYHYGIQNKTMGSHKMNMTSSRSHTIFTVTVEQVLASNPDNTIISKLQIVDLAGSERQSLTKTEGVAQKESIEINKSLFTLRKVITALTERAKQQNHGVDSKELYIPYRDSKLTCLLRQSLGGNSTTLMIACLHPGNQYFEENNSTLTYAAKAALIRNRPVKNDDPQTKLIEELKTQVKSLSMELLRANQYIEQICVISGQPVRKFGLGLLPSTIQLNETQNSIAVVNSTFHNQELRKGSLQNQRSSASKLIQASPYSTNTINSKSYEIDGSKEQFNQQNQQLVQNLGNLRTQLQQQAFITDGLKSDLFQKQLENEDLRQRLQYLETLTGKDSTMIRDQITDDTSKVDWAQLLLDDQTDDMIITVSREKIAHEIIRLRNELSSFRNGSSQMTKTQSQRTQSDYNASKSILNSSSSVKKSQSPFGPTPGRQITTQQNQLFNSASRTEIRDEGTKKRQSMQHETTSSQMRASTNQSAAEQYLNSMGVMQVQANSTRRSNKSVTNSSGRQNVRQQTNPQQRLEPLPPRASLPKGGGSVSGRKSQSKNKLPLKDPTFFSPSTDPNLYSTNSSPGIGLNQKSAFSQALENVKKRDYITLVANSMPLDVRSDDGMNSNNYDSDYQKHHTQYQSESGAHPHMQTLQDEDSYPYVTPSPYITKPSQVGGLSQKRFISEYGTDSEIDRVAVANLSANSIKNAQQKNKNNVITQMENDTPQPHVTMRKRNATTQESSIKEENEDDD